MKIFLLNTARGWGGLESHSIILAKALLDLGHEVVLGCRKGGNVEQEALAHKIPITNITMRNAVDIGSLIQVRDFIKTNGMEVVVANLGKEYWPATVAAKLAGVEIVLFRHQLDPVKSITRWLINTAVARVIAVTHAVKQVMITSGVQANKIEVVHPGLNVERFQSSAKYRSSVRAEYNISDQDIVIAAVGKLHPGKGIYELLEAVEQLSANNQNLKVMYIGDGEERHHLPERAKELGMADQIIMTGYRSDIDRLFSAIDIFALPSKGYESFGMVLIEAMAAGKPVIGTATGGIPEIITDSQSGLLVAPGSVDELAKAIDRLITEPDFRQRLIAAGHEKVKENFTDTASASKLAAILEAIRNNK